jgi:hypothetical protein
VGELLGQPVGGVVEVRARLLRAAVLVLYRGSLGIGATGGVRHVAGSLRRVLRVAIVHEVRLGAESSALLLGAPNLLLAILVWVDGLRESRRSGGELAAISSGRISVVAKAEVELKPLRLLLLLRWIVVHLAESRSIKLGRKR